MKRVLLVLLLVTLHACAPSFATTMPAPAAVSPTVTYPTDTPAPPSAFLHVQGRDIVDASGQPIFLRGVNMDTYYYGYLWGVSPWDYATQEDIQYLDSLGVTAIRLGLHWRYFDTSLGFDLIDAYLDWCEQAGIYVILDMHVVPPEDDILEGKMWDDPAAQQKFLDLWTAIAARYADRTIIAGYDLYNEPLPPTAAQWWNLAKRAITTIRAVDTNHILFVETPLIEGVLFELMPDSNVVYSFHDYEPFVVSHAGAQWVGDSPVPVDYSYPGPALIGVEWADWSGDAVVFTGQTNKWLYWDSGTLIVPPGVEFATLRPAAYGDAGAVWFDDLEVDHNGVPQTIYNPGMEEASIKDASLPANWFFWSDSGFSGEWSREQAHSGTYSLKISSDGDGFGVWGQNAGILTEPLFRVRAGDTFRVRGWIYAPHNNGRVSLGLDYLNGVYENYDRARLLAAMQPFIDWGIANNVPLFVGEFGAMSSAPGDSRVNLAGDKISVMNEAGLHWTMWTYSGSDPSFGLIIDGDLDERLADILRQGLHQQTPQVFTLLLPLIVIERQGLPAQTETPQAPPAPSTVPPTVTYPTDTPSPTPSAVPLTIHYTPSSADIPNPERGFYVWLSETSPDWYAEHGYTIAYTRQDLREYISGDLPPEYLQRLSALFQLARQAGIKLIIRFTYNEGETYPDPAPDASLQQVLRHIEQLAPVLEANKDVIAWFEAGFIGAWGEWHTSASGLDTPENKAAIRDALYRYFPRDRFILFRYPGDFTRWYPQPLTEAQAFTQSNQARTGHHNDCFLASDDDWGTYYDYDGSLKNEEWKTYLSQMTRFTPMSGETCNPNPPRSDCPAALQEMELLHWSAINEEWHPDVVQGWKDQGCYAEIRKRLGYRLTLLEAAYNSQVQPGSELRLEIKLNNTGFASPMLPRPVYLILAGQDKTLSYPVPADPRRWQPGEHDLTASVSLPADFPPGAYNLALWLPDPSVALHEDPRYAIQFANENIWDAEHGWNVLGEVQVLAGE